MRTSSGRLKRCAAKGDRINTRRHVLISLGAVLFAPWPSRVAQAQQRMDIILVAIVAAGTLGFTLNLLFAQLRRHLLRWQPAIA